MPGLKIEAAAGVEVATGRDIRDLGDRLLGAARRPMRTSYRRASAQVITDGTGAIGTLWVAKFDPVPAGRIWDVRSLVVTSLSATEEDPFTTLNAVALAIFMVGTLQPAATQYDPSGFVAGNNSIPFDIKLGKAQCLIQGPERLFCWIKLLQLAPNQTFVASMAALEIEDTEDAREELL